MVKPLKAQRPAKAADRAAQATPAPQQEPTVTLPALPVGAINLILEGLSELPLKRTAPLFGLIQAEAQRQLQPASPPLPAPAAAPAGAP